MDAYQFLSNGEAQPVPFGRSGVVALIHPLKDMGEISGGNPFPVISHYDFCLLLRFGHGQGHLSCAAVRQDILQQVIENTCILFRVSLSHRKDCDFPAAAPSQP